MFSVLGNSSYRNLFFAQVIALFGTGLMTVALALLAFELAGEDSGAVLGTALAIKMVIYVFVSPFAAAFAARLPRSSLLVILDVVRAGTAIALPFVDAVWQIYVLIAILQTASATFTPTFQATIPELFPGEEEYTKALALSRLAYDLENLLSPVIAALLIGLIGFHWLFGGTVMGFLVSAVLIALTPLQIKSRPSGQGPLARTLQGMNIYLRTPRLQGLFALNLAVAASGAMVIVNGVVLVKGYLGLSDTDLALSMAAYGGGSMVLALALPRVLHRVRERTIMIGGAAVLPLALFALGVAMSGLDLGQTWYALLITWLAMGAGMSMVMLPSGRLLRRSAHSEDRPLVFAAQFALSHVGWLIAYPLAGWLGSTFSLQVTMFVLAGLALVGVFVAWRVWPGESQSVLDHEHPELPADHPHIKSAHGKRHAHPFVIDDLHHHWPQQRH